MIAIPIWLLVVILIPYALVIGLLIIYIIAGFHDLAVAKKIAQGKVKCPYEVEGKDEIH